MPKFFTAHILLSGSTRLAVGCLATALLSGCGGGSGGESSSGSNVVVLPPTTPLPAPTPAPAPGPTPAPAPAAAFATATALVFVDQSALQSVRDARITGARTFNNSIAGIVARANDALLVPLDPVTSKTRPPPNGNRNDYYSLSPYYWPNPNTPDGLPWVRRDGEINPLTRGGDTDQVRTTAMLDQVRALTLGYEITRDARYAARLNVVLSAWFIDPATRVNPQIRYGQSIPGSRDGASTGFIEWHELEWVVTASQIMKRDALWPVERQNGLDQWIADYDRYINTGPFAAEADAHTNNFGTSNDWQRIGLALYFRRDAEATALAERMKTLRISGQIAPDGSQPRELARTNSIGYSILNLRRMVRTGVMVRRLGVDLFAYRSSDGRSIAAAIDFLAPYANDPARIWPYPQTGGGGLARALEREMKSGLAAFEVMTGRNVLTPTARAEGRAFILSYDRVHIPIPD